MCKFDCLVASMYFFIERIKHNFTLELLCLHPDGYLKWKNMTASIVNKDVGSHRYIHIIKQYF